MKKSQDKLFIVRKYVKAPDAASALRKEKGTKVHDVFVDEEWEKGHKNTLAESIGFSVERRNNDDD